MTIHRPDGAETKGKGKKAEERKREATRGRPLGIIAAITNDDLRRVTKGDSREPRRAGPEVRQSANRGPPERERGRRRGRERKGDARGLIYRAASIEINSPSDPVRLKTRRLIDRPIDRSRGHFGWRLYDETTNTTASGLP